MGKSDSPFVKTFYFKSNYLSQCLSRILLPLEGPYQPIKPVLTSGIWALKGSNPPTFPITFRVIPPPSTAYNIFTTKLLYT